MHEFFGSYLFLLVSAFYGQEGRPCNMATEKDLVEEQWYSV